MHSTCSYWLSVLIQSKVKPSAKEINLVEAVSNAKDVTRFISCQRLQEPCATLADLTKVNLYGFKHHSDYNLVQLIQLPSTDLQSAYIVTFYHFRGDDSLSFVAVVAFF